MTTQHARLSPAVLTGVTLWRLLIVVLAFTGLLLALRGDLENLEALSQSANLLTGLVYLGLLAYPLFTGGRRHEPHSPWPRGAVTVTMVLVCATYMGLMSGNVDRLWSLLEHLITPLAVLADWLFVGRATANARWWHPITWLAVPLAYLVYYNAAGLRQYDRYIALRYSDPDFPAYLAGFLVALLVVGYVLYGLGKLRSPRRSP